MIVYDNETRQFSSTLEDVNSRIISNKITRKADKANKLVDRVDSENRKGFINRGLNLIPNAVRLSRARRIARKVDRLKDKYRNKLNENNEL